MRRRMLRWGWLAAGLCLAAGCSYGTQGVIDSTVCELSAHPWDLQPRVHPDATPQPGSTRETLPPPREVPKAAEPPLLPVSFTETSRDSLRPAFTPDGDGGTGTRGQTATAAANPLGLGVRPAAANDVAALLLEQAPSRTGTLLDRLKIPPDLPGGKAPPITLPPATPENREKREAAIRALYPPLPPLGEEPGPAPGPHGKPLTLADLQMLGLSSSPLIRQAAANVESARGNAIQVGLPPNPNIGYEADTMGTIGGPGYQGGYFEQTIKTGNKLQLARAVATMDLRNAELALRRAEFDLATNVRRGFFGVLVAEQTVRVTRALAEFTGEIYDIQAELAAKGLAAAYEPMQLRVQAVQARAALVQARNQRNVAWKQLAAAMGLPGLPYTALAGSVDLPLPQFDYDKALARVLSVHTDVRSAEARQLRARYALALARITPVPDVFLRVLVQKDRTGPPFDITPSVILGMPVPVWDRNQGGIIQAEADLVAADEQSHTVRSSLTSSLAEAFGRYQSSRTLLGYYRDHILPDQVRAYRGVLDRYLREPGGAAANPPAFADIVNAQQILGTTITQYLTTLQSLWTSVVDVADLMQTEDLFGMQTDPHAIAPVPTLESLPPLPCTHPCSPLHGPAMHGADGSWQNVTPPLEQPTPPAALQTLPPPREVPLDRAPEKAPPKPAEKAPEGPRFLPDPTGAPPNGDPASAGPPQALPPVASGTPLPPISSPAVQQANTAAASPMRGKPDRVPTSDPPQIDPALFEPPPVVGVSRNSR